MKRVLLALAGLLLATPAFACNYGVGMAVGGCGVAAVPVQRQVYAAPVVQQTVAVQRTIVVPQTTYVQQTITEQVPVQVQQASVCVQQAPALAPMSYADQGYGVGLAPSYSYGASYGVGLAPAFAPSYGVGAAFVPSYGIGYGVGGVVRSRAVFVGNSFGVGYGVGAVGVGGVAVNNTVVRSRVGVFGGGRTVIRSRSVIVP